ncbi:MAG: hypothetical protein ACYDEX_07975 [Mobilitalea sp.]
MNAINMKKLVYFHLFYLLIVGFLIYDCHFPYGITYLLDVLLVFEVIYSAKYYLTIVSLTKSKLIFIVLLLLFACTIIGFIMNSYSLFSYIIGFRNTAKYFLFFLSCLVILDKDDIESIFELLYRFLLINAVVCTIQYFVFNIVGDYCNGLFGSGLLNSWMNVLLCIVTTYGVARYMSKQISFKKLLLIGLTSVYISVLAEIKFYYFELILIVLIVLVLSKPNRKVFTIVFTGIVFLFVIRSYTEQLWSGSAKYFTKEGIEYYFTQDSYGYSSINDIGRVGGISKLNSLIFSEKDNINLFGMGLGFCDINSAFIINNSFYVMYEYLHYSWFTYLITYLELGWIGLILYILFFAIIFITSIKSVQHNTKEEAIASKSTQIIIQTIAILSIVLLWYNSTIRNTPAFFIFAVLSFAPILNKPLSENYMEAGKHIKLFKIIFR